MGDNDFATGYALGQDSGGGNGSGGGWGGFGEGIWGIIILAMVFGWGNGGWGGFGGGGSGAQGAVTRSDLCSEFNFNNLDNAVRGIQQGLCDGFYAQNSAISNGFHGVDNAICNLGYTTQQGFNATQVAMMQGQNALATQLANCCCENRAGQADIKYQMATDTCAIQNTIQSTTRDMIDNQNAGTRAILDYLCQKEAADLRAENQSLKLAASQAAQNNYLISELRPTAQPAYITCNPFTGQYGGYQYNNCGCNSGCGC